MRDEDQKRAYNREYGRAYRRRERDKVRVTQANAWARYRAEAITALGGVCVACGIDDPVVLDIDHVGGDGHLDRKRRARVTILRAVAAGEPGYQLLCANCHRRKTAAAGDHLAKHAP